MSKPEFIENTNLIGKKVSASPHKTADQLLKEAEKKIGALQGEFTKQLKTDMPKLITMVQAASDATDPIERAKHIESLARLAHELRGQGGTFGYPLVSAICDSCCRFIEGSPEFDDKRMSIIRSHIDALRAVVATEMTGDGGAVGKELLNTLAVALNRFASES